MGEAPRPVTDLDWDPARARALGERTLAIWEQLLEELPGLPVARRHDPATVRAAVVPAVPDQPLSLDQLDGWLRRVILEYAMYPGHPGFQAYISGAGTVPGAAADLLAAAANMNTGGWRLSPSGTELELALMQWFTSRLGMPEGAGGLLTSGGAMANLFALAMARDVRAGWDVRRLGVAAGPPLVVYATDQVHDTVDRGCDLLGMGAGAIHRVATDGSQRMDPGDLARAIANDVTAGRQPLAVVASAGTVGTGAIDPLGAIADIAGEHGLWLHVDGAYGGPAAMVDELRPRFAGIERADSVSFDPHKWLYVPIAAGCVLARDGDHLAWAFHIDPSYTREDKAVTGRGFDFHVHSPYFTRPFAALKIWLSLLAHGWDAYQRRIAHDVALARYLTDRAREHPELEPLTEPELSIACFRFVPADLGDGDEREQYLDTLNERVMLELQLAGETFPSNVVVDGSYGIRSCIVNFRTEAGHLDALVAAVVRTGHALDAELRPASMRS